jgi:hypothetical protein
MVEEKASSGDPTLSVLLESVLAHCYELWFLNLESWLNLEILFLL